MRFGFGNLMVACVVLLGCLAVGARAEQYTSSQRFLVPGQEDMTGAEDVKITPMDSNSLPEAMQTEIQSILDRCVEDSVSLSSLKAYLYESKRTRVSEAYPNIIVDFSALSGKKLKRCAQPFPLCQNQSCALAGYTYDGGSTSWKPVFAVSALRWTVDAIKPTAKSHVKQETFFKIVSDIPLCEEQGGKLQEGTCVQDFVWRGEGLVPLNPVAASSVRR